MGLIREGTILGFQGRAFGPRPHCPCTTHNHHLDGTASGRCKSTCKGNIRGFGEPDLPASSSTRIRTFLGIHVIPLERCEHRTCVDAASSRDRQRDARDYFTDHVLT
ncbi:hypothetical protein PsYK624_129970 [Phanerochaete sordida]|uniref:Uncharacterized protein n=1 Tax=Phanerochaete sordida TaxID=48140 RepID=A0A9P3LIR1_9APHY|nr:hypothetical protein PsYK624_129970 [Phanerochaete sordida]